MAVVKFKTNIDCCKKFMSQISGLPLEEINPTVGDQVRVYHDSAIDVYLKVIERTWIMTNGSNPVLECELHLNHGTIQDLEKHLEKS